MSNKNVKDTQESMEEFIELSLVCSKSDDVTTLVIQTMNSLSKHRQKLSKDNGIVKTVKIIILCLSSCGINKNHFSEIITRQVRALFPKAEAVVNFETVSSDI